MIFPATQEIEKLFLEKDIHCSVDDDDECSRVMLSMECDNITFRAMFISRDDTNRVAMRIYRLLKYPAEKTDAIIDTVNECNSEFRFVCFVADTETNTVDVEYDFPGSISDIGEAAYELLHRAAGIIDECYPKFMRCIYA